MEFKGFDEDDCVEFIREELSEEVNDKHDDDEILYIVDTIWDWYERNGLIALEVSDDTSDEVDIDKLLKFVKKEVHNSEFIEMHPTVIEAIVRAELRYEESLDDIF